MRDCEDLHALVLKALHPFPEDIFTIDVHIAHRQFGNVHVAEEHVPVQVAALGGSLWALVTGLRRFHRPSRADALARLQAIVDGVAVPPKARRPTKPTYSSKLKRLETKGKRAGIKSLRGRPRGDD